MNEKGFSLSEVIVALLLLTGLSLTLMKQQWQIQKWQTHIKREFFAHLQNANALERGEEVGSQKGMTLLELLIGLVLSLSLSFLLLQQYVHIRSYFQLVTTEIDQFSRLQIILDGIRHSARQSGFTPCQSLNQLQTSAGLVAISGKPDQLILQKMAIPYLKIKRLYKYTLVANTGTILPEKPLIIADCNHAEIIQDYKILSTHPQLKIHSKTPFVFSYQPPIYLGHFIQEAFEVRQNKQGQSALFYLNPHSEELMQNIQHFNWEINRVGARSILHLDILLDKMPVLPLDIGLHS